MRLAKERGQNIYVLFTASWCGPCVRFSQNVFSKQETADFLNKNFIPLKFEHGVADSSYFNKYGIRAFPTNFVADSNMKSIQKSIARSDAKSFQNSISAYAKPSTNIQNSNQNNTTDNINNTNSTDIEESNEPNRPNPVVPLNATLAWQLTMEDGEKGQIVLSSNGSWSYLENQNVKYKLMENRRDEYYIILLNQTKNEWWAVPVIGQGKALVYRNDTWVDLGQVSN